MHEILTAEDMRRADQAALASGLTCLELMRAAGQAVASRIIQDYKLCPVLVLCGSGSNGGDGFVTASLLEKSGWPVRVACSVKTTDLTGDAALACKSYNGKIKALNSNLVVKDAEIVIDAVFGTGFSGMLPPELVTLFDKVRAKAPTVIAIDLPSGIDASSGHSADGVLQAELTVTFCRKKIAHMLSPSRQLCGRIVCTDIGIDDQTVAGLKTQTFENNPALWLASMPLPSHDSHKFSRGHLGVYGGSHRTGAAALAARAGQCAGAGVVSIACPPESALYYRLAGPSLLIDTCDTPQDTIALLTDARINAVVVGSGALPAQGGEEALRTLTAAVIASGKPAVFDGDIFSAFEHTPQDILGKLDPARHVLTPHAGEFLRLFGHIEGSKLEQARSAAVKANAIVVFKGADTVIAAPEGLAVIDTSGPPTLATAGSGDVLAGLIAGFAAQGMSPFFAACAGVFLHARAARLHGLGLRAEDIISHIPQALNQLFGLDRKDR